MKKFVFLLIIVFSVTSNGSIQAQRLLRNLKNKIERKVEQKVEERIEEKVDEEIDKKLEEEAESADSSSTGQLSESEREQARVQNIMGRLGMNSTPVPYENSYSFSSNIKMEIETYKGDKLKDKGHINSFFNEDNMVFAYEFTDEEDSEDKKGFFIYDQNNNASIILSEDDGEMKGIVTGIDMEQMGAFAAEQVENDPDADPVDFDKAHKTGRTKKILGYTCEEYAYKDEHDESAVWITKDKVADMGSLFSSVYKNSAIVKGYPGGMIMEAVSKDLESDEKSIMRIIEINENITKEVDLSSYEIVNMGSISIPASEE